MNEKIPLKKFAGQLGATCGVGEDIAQRFIKELFSLVADRLSEGETVAVDGLGKFSVNPSLEDPVVFVPDQEFADEVNAPFAMFEPIPMREELSDSNLDALSEVDEEYASLVEEDRDSVDNQDRAVAVEACDTEKPTSDVDNEDHEYKALQPDQVAEADSTVTTIDVAENDVKTLDEQEDKVVESSKTIASEGIEQEETPAAQECTYNEETVIEQVDVDTTEAQSPEADSYIPEDEEEYIEYYDRPKSKFGLGFVIGLLTGLLVGALALAGYAIFFVNASAR